MKILLLAGGDSSEREISLTTGRAVYESLRRQGHEIIAVDPASGYSLLANDGEYLPSSIGSPEGITELPTAFATQLGERTYKEVELVFLALHGGTGENGVIQNLLDLAGMKYTGSSMTASAIAMNKDISKRLFSSVNVKTPPWRLYSVDKSALGESTCEDIAENFDFPVVVKPNTGGSTIGLTKVDSPDALPEALNCAAREDTNILVERYIKGREMTVAILDSHAFPVVEIIPKEGLYDYAAKYTAGKSEYVAPAVIPDEVTKNIREAAVAVYDVIGASGVARVDFVLEESGEFYCLELNSLPGMTDLSLVPMAARCEGIEFDQLVEMMIQYAIKRTV